MSYLCSVLCANLSISRSIYLWVRVSETSLSGSICLGPRQCSVSKFGSRPPRHQYRRFTVQTFSVSHIQLSLFSFTHVLCFHFYLTCFYSLLIEMCTFRYFSFNQHPCAPLSFRTFLPPRYQEFFGWLIFRNFHFNLYAKANFAGWNLSMSNLLKTSTNAAFIFRIIVAGYSTLLKSNLIHTFFT